MHKRTIAYSHVCACPVDTPSWAFITSCLERAGGKWNSFAESSLVAMQIGQSMYVGILSTQTTSTETKTCGKVYVLSSCHWGINLARTVIGHVGSFLSISSQHQFTYYACTSLMLEIVDLYKERFLRKNHILMSACVWQSDVFTSTAASFLTCKNKSVHWGISINIYLALF